MAVDPYGPSSPEFIVDENFAHMWCSALAFCQRRYHGQIKHWRNEPSGGIGCFSPDSFPVIDVFRQNCYVIADSNHGYKMIALGKLVAHEILGAEQPPAGAVPVLPFRRRQAASGLEQSVPLELTGIWRA